MMGLIRRNRDELDQAGQLRKPTDKAFQARHPDLIAWLFDQQYADGTKRQPGTLSIRGSDLGFTVSVLDHDGQCSCYRSGKTLVDALDSASEAISNPETKWVQWKRGRGQTKG